VTFALQHPVTGDTVPLNHKLLAGFVPIFSDLLVRRPWAPNPDKPDKDGVLQPHPQRLAFESEADITGYGGAAGGGKTDLACGLALTRHRKTLMLRRVGTELLGIEDRLEELIGTKDGFNGQKKVWKRTRLDYVTDAQGRTKAKAVKQQIEFASLPNLGDEKGFQGRPHDLIVYDEAANFLEQQVRFLLGWLRSTVKGQRCRALMCFNPPTSAEGRWIIAFFAPWLDPNHPDPAEYGELRWFGTVEGKDYPVADGRPFVLTNDTPDYDFDPADYRGELQALVITPLSRTFIPSRVTDNPHLMGTGYMAQLQALPEPLRSQMLNGDFMAGMSDDAWQVIPTAWVEAAMARWKPKEVKPPMDSVGVDVARGKEEGNSAGDETTISRRHGRWYDKLLVYPGSETPSGNETASLAIMARRDLAPIHIDVIGVGASPYDMLRNQHQQVVGVDVREKALGTDKSGRLRFPNQRSELIWKFREALDPDNNRGLQLPPDPVLKADLCAWTFKPEGMMIRVASRDEIIKRIGRSPDRASAVILAQLETPKISYAQAVGSKAKEHDPYANLR